MKLTPEQVFDELAKEVESGSSDSRRVMYEAYKAFLAGCRYQHERTREAAAKMCEISGEQLKLMAGEMTAQEVRTAQAVLKSRAAAIRALTLDEC